MISGQKKDESQAVALATRLFSVSLIKELAQKGHSSLFAELAGELSTLKPNPFLKCASSGELFDCAFNFLKKKDYRLEYIYKTAIAHKVLMGVHSLKTATMINEFRIGNNKADSVILNGTSTVYEIKSERDSLTRLEHQIDAYQKVFAKVNVIIGEKHLASVQKLVPKEVGVLLLSDRYQISSVRDAIDMAANTNVGVIFDSIRLSEAKKILELQGIVIPQVPNTLLAQTLRKEFIKLTSLQAHSGMVSVLRESRSHRPLAEFIGMLPSSVQLAALSINFNKMDKQRLILALNTPINNALKWN